MKSLGLAVVALVGFQAVAAWSDGAFSNWRFDPYARREGNLLIVDVPKGASGGAARCTVDLTRFEKGVEFHVRCRGENVTKPSENWLGFKFMLHFTDGDGTENWPGAAQRSGTFDWFNACFAPGFGKGAKGGKGELTFGLQNASGKVVFDLSTLKIVERQDIWTVPAADRDYRCVYTREMTSSPRRRGVMLPAGACKEDDFRTLKAWGATLVRYQMCRNWSKENDNHDLTEYDRWLDGKLEHLDRDVLPWAEKYALAVVVDLHVAPGGRADSDMNMFYDRTYGDHFIVCWRKIARRFRGRRNIYGYDLINEPSQRFSGVTDGDWWNLQRRAAEAVRAIDPDVTIVLESNDWDSPKAFSYLRPLRMTNVIYQAHMYQPMAFTHQGVKGKAKWTPAKYPDPDKGWDKDFLRQQLADVRKFQLEHGAKIYIGEFSAIAWAEGADAYLRDCMSLFEEYGWDWSYHAFREWPGWSVERTCAAPGEPFVPSADNPRLRALKDALARDVRGETRVCRSSPRTAPASATDVCPVEGFLRTVNDRLAREFISHDGLLLDYVGEIPTAADVADLRPNAMGWWSPIENGAMFTGEWLPALMAEGEGRKATVERCVRGLVKMSEVSDVPGFIARGTGTDGKCHFPCGSNDQTDPWFFGLLEYCRWKYADPALRARVLGRAEAVAKALEANDWGVPCDGPFTGENRGNLNSGQMPFWGKSRLLYTVRSLAELTGDHHWQEVYAKLLTTAIDGIEAGGEVDVKAFAGCYTHGVWIYVSSAQMLARLIEMERDARVRARLSRGFAKFAARVAPLMAERRKYDNAMCEKPFRYANWREGWKWRPQKTQREAEAVAYSPRPEVIGGRKEYERHGMANPLAAAAVCALQGDAAYRDEIRATLAHYDYATANISEFFSAAIAAARLLTPPPAVRRAPD